MSEIDEAWAFALAEAEARARLAGRNDVADYLALRNSNDLLRRTGIEWLIKTFTDIAGSANRAGSSIQSSKQESHRFRVGEATMVGTLLTLRLGVRVLSIEAGWPRTPRDGIVRGGGLACANIKHLGIKSACQELLLTVSPSGAPRWVVVGDQRCELHQADAENHVAILFDEL